MRKLLLVMFALMMTVYVVGQKSKMVLDPVTTQVDLSGTQPPHAFYSPAHPDAPATETTVWALPENGGTSANTRAPGNNYKYQRTEYLITPAEMAASDPLVHDGDGQVCC